MAQQCSSLEQDVCVVNVVRCCVCLQEVLSQ